MTCYCNLGQLLKKFRVVELELEKGLRAVVVTEVTRAHVRPVNQYDRAHSLIQTELVSIRLS